MRHTVHEGLWIAEGTADGTELRLLRGMLIGLLLVLPFWTSVLALVIAELH